VGARCSVEASAVVDGSVLLAGARVGAGARVVGSIIGHGASVGEDCELEPLTVVGDQEIVHPRTHLAGDRVPAEVTE
jgi:mannose-1-phosphate guanylyltransferase